MTEWPRLLLLAPLGAGLLYVVSPAPDAPVTDRVTAESPRPVDAARGADAGPQLDVADIVATEIDYAPAKAAFLETVVLQASPGEKKSAIRELRLLGTDTAVRALSLALTDDDDRIREAALEALAAIGSDEALAVIASALRSEKPVDRAIAAEALALSEGYSAVDYLERFLHDEDPRVRAAAVESLGDIGDGRSLDIISMALRDNDPEVRERAVEILDQLDDEALFHTLYPKR